MSSEATHNVSIAMLALVPIALLPSLVWVLAFVLAFDLVLLILLGSTGLGEKLRGGWLLSKRGLQAKENANLKKTLEEKWVSGDSSWKLMTAHFEDISFFFQGWKNVNY